ncbi:hypothetical protein TanjilG_26098 [Lupinus angustifolius]|uniref:GATA-type domain-containing protein n=1 Tax=Lupinus angustifolius TaxID=3871 RepID=A0A4P1R268_LUPAN|nr:PREDICTED: GATA transcription factor 21-like [Lupinus angustifolius]OIV99760.1 hypothetical protein TanjilG_26098 [Lupinus angustifolius]
MIPAYPHSLSSIMPPLDHNHHHLFNPNHQASSSLFSSSSFHTLFNPSDHDQQGSFCWEPKHLPSDHEETGKIIPLSGSSWDQTASENHESSIGSKVTVWKKEDMAENLQAGDEDGSLKLLPSKMRIMRKMMVSGQTTDSYVGGSSMQKFEDQKQPLSPLGTDNSSNNYPKHSNNIVRVCSDCHTTKTPLWRSGPRGPKSLCNACGIRQRKARRAMAVAAAASENGTIVVAAAQKSVKGKEKKSKVEYAPQQMKRKRKLIAKPSSESRNKFSFEDLTLRLSKNVAFKQVFPQDEREAAILLMALSYGLVHG